MNVFISLSKWWGDRLIELNVLIFRIPWVKPPLPLVSCLMQAVYGNVIIVNFPLRILPVVMIMQPCAKH
ncbi:hypothetical protein D3C72_2394620 [compost metagenome]